jgi:ethanolamine permease
MSRKIDQTKLLKIQNLARVVPWWMIIPWLIGGVTGGDFFITNTFIVSQAGPLTPWAYITAGIFIILMSLIYWELISAWPYTGGEYVYLTRSFGSFIGYLIFFLYAFNFVFWVPLNLSVIGSYLKWLFPDWRINAAIISVIVAIIFHWIVYRGIFFSTKVQVIFSIITILGTTLIFFVPFLISPTQFLKLASQNLNPNPMFPGLGNKITGLLAFSGLTITYMVGFEVVPQLAEEIKAEEKRLGFIQTMGSLGMTYIQTLCAIGMVAIIPQTVWLTLAGTELNIPAAAMQIAPKLLPLNVVRIILAAEIFSAFATMTTAITGFTRSIFALARDIRFPQIFTYLHPKYKSPVAAVILSLVISIFGSFQRWVVDYAFGLVMATMFMYIMIPIAHIILRKREPNIQRPAKTPFFPWVNLVVFAWAVYMFWYQVKTVPISVWYFLGAIVILSLIIWVIYNPIRKRVYEEAGVKERFGIKA